jgi:hypothetical protein
MAERLFPPIHTAAQVATDAAMYRVVAGHLRGVSILLQLVGHQLSTAEQQAAVTFLGEQVGHMVAALDAWYAVRYPEAWHPPETHAENRDGPSDHPFP